MAKFNKTVLIGRLTRDPEVRYTPAGKAVCDMTLGFNTGFKENEKSNFLDVTFWESQAEFCGEFLKKGQEVLVEGEISQDTWEDKESGQKRSKMRLRGLTVQILGAKKGAAETTTENDESVPF